MRSPAHLRRDEPTCRTGLLFRCGFSATSPKRTATRRCLVETAEPNSPCRLAAAASPGSVLRTVAYCDGQPTCTVLPSQSRAGSKAPVDQEPCLNSYELVKDRRPKTAHSTPATSSAALVEGRRNIVASPAVVKAVSQLASRPVERPGRSKPTGRTRRPFHNQTPSAIIPTAPKLSRVASGGRPVFQGRSDRKRQCKHRSAYVKRKLRRRRRRSLIGTSSRADRRRSDACRPRWPLQNRRVVELFRQPRSFFEADPDPLPCGTVRARTTSVVTNRRASSENFAVVACGCLHRLFETTCRCLTATAGVLEQPLNNARGVGLFRQPRGFRDWLPVLLSPKGPLRPEDLL